MGQTSVVQIPFAGGLDQKVAAEYLEPGGRVASIVNGNYAKVNAVDKRIGIKSLPNTVLSGPLGAPATGVRAAGWSRSGLSLVASAQAAAPTGGLYTFSPAAGGLVGVAQLPSCAVRRRPVIAQNTSQPPVFCDFPVGTTTWRMAVYYDTAFNVYANVHDLTSGDVIMEPVRVYTNGGSILSGTFPYIKNVLYFPNATAGQQIALFIYDGNTANLRVATFNYSSLTFSAFSTLVNSTGGYGASSMGMCDVAPFINDPSGGYLVLYQSSATIAKLVYYQGTTAQTTQTVETLAGGNTFQFGCYAVGTWGESVWVLYPFYNGATYSYHIAGFQGNAALTSQAGPTTAIANSATQHFITTLNRVNSNHVFFQYYDISNPSGGASGVQAPLGTWATFSSSLAQIATGPTPLGFLPVGRAFFTGGAMCQPGYTCLYVSYSTAPSNTRSGQYSMHLWQYSNVLSSPATDTVNVYPIATVAPRQVDMSTFMLGGVFLGTGAAAYLPSTLNFNSQSADGQSRYGIGLKVLPTEVPAALTANYSGAQGTAWETDFLFDTASLAALYQSNELGNCLYLAGGVEFEADSATAFETSFFYYPEFLYTTTSSTASALSTGNYQWAVIYANVDGAGRIQRSAPSYSPVQAITNGGAKPTLHIPALSVTWRDRQVKGQVWAQIYRTTANGGTFYYVDRVAVSGQSGTPVEITWTDNNADTAVSVASILYTTGGVLDGVNPPASLYQCTHQSRVALVDETARNVWFSTQFSPGEAPRFNEALVVPFNEGGDITAVASMDSNFIVFKQNSIWVMSGDGPAVTGQGSNWSTPYRVASDVGCISWQSVVLTPMGLLFQASSGIYLLGRDLQVTFIGKNVVDTLALFPTITSAVLVPQATQVRFTCSNGSTTTTIAYDYLLDAWLTHTYPSLTAPVASACLDYATGQYSLLTTDGNIWQERLPSDPNLYLDTDSSSVTHFVPTMITSAWVKGLGLQGQQRVRWVNVLGDQQETCGMQVQLATNYNPTVVQTGNWSAQQLANLKIPGQVALHPSGFVNNQQSMQVTVSDVAPASPTTGAGMRWLGLSLELDLLGQRWAQVPVAGRR